MANDLAHYVTFRRISYADGRYALPGKCDYKSSMAALFDARGRGLLLQDTELPGKPAEEAAKLK
jgi:hypothetical protein